MYKWQPQWTQYLIVMLAIEWISYSIIPKSLMKVEAVKWIIIRAFCGKVNWKRSKWIQQTNWVLTDSILNLSSSHFEFYLNWQASQVEWNFFQGVRVCGDGRGKWARSLSKDVGKWKCSGVECCGSVRRGGNCRQPLTRQAAITTNCRNKPQQATNQQPTANSHHQPKTQKPKDEQRTALITNTRP